MGSEFHYGLFRKGDEALQDATRALTDLLEVNADIRANDRVLDVGSGVGGPACRVARRSGATVIGITTSRRGVEEARARASAEGLSETVLFEQRDATANGFPDRSFERILVLESSHLMRRRDRLISECARVLVPHGRLALCDIVLRRRPSFEELRTRRREFGLLRDVFGDARMEPVGLYRQLMTSNGLDVDTELDLSRATRPTFDRWRQNATHHGVAVRGLLGDLGWKNFVDACGVLEDLWDNGTLGYGLIVASKP